MDKHYNNVMKLIAKHGGVNANFLAALKIQREKEYKEELLRIKIRAQHKASHSVASGGSLPITEEELRYYLNEKKWSLFGFTNFNHSKAGIMLRLKEGLIHAETNKNYFYVANRSFLEMNHTTFLANLNYWIAGVYEVDKIPLGLLYEVHSSLPYNEIRTFIKDHDGIQEGYKRTGKGKNCFGVLIKEGNNNRWDFERALQEHRNILSFKLLETRRKHMLAAA